MRCGLVFSDNKSDQFYLQFREQLLDQMKVPNATPEIYPLTKNLYYQMRVNHPQGRIPTQHLRYGWRTLRGWLVMGSWEGFLISDAERILRVYYNKETSKLFYFYGSLVRQAGGIWSITFLDASDPDAIDQTVLASAEQSAKGLRLSWGNRSIHFEEYWYNFSHF